MKKNLLILIALFTVVIGYSQTFTDNFITYTVTSTTNNTVRVNSYNPAGGTDVNIPTTVLNNSITYNVTSINDFAFVNNQLTSVALPNSIVNINMAAFAQNQLTSFTIPNSVVSIGTGVLSGNPLTCVISEATTPPTITTGGSNDSFALNGDRSNIDLSIPSGTASAYTAAEWTGFKSVAEGLTGTFVVDYITYEINPTPNSEVTITDYSSAGVTIVNIPSSVNSGCREYSVVSIDEEAFIGGSLTSVTIPDSVINIGANAFNDNDITTLTIGNGLETIGDGVFANNQIGSVIIPDNVTSIELYAFAFNELISIDIPDTVTSIGEGAFRNNLLNSATLPDGLVSIPNLLFIGNQLTNITIPNNVTSIGFSAFNGNQLNSVTIPSNVTTIGEYAFQNNPLLTDVISESIIPPTITTGGSEDTFGTTQRGNINLTIPNGTDSAYIAAQWINFASVTLNISDFEVANNIKVITNADAINIVSSNSVKLENYTLYSISGAKIYSGKNSEINTSSISNGIYILKLDFDRGSISKKIVIH